MVVVTGGCGFIGRHVVAELRKNGHDVMVIDNLSTSHEPPFEPDILADVKDVRASSLPDFDVMIHLAAMASVPECEKRPEDAWTENVDTTLIAAELAAACGASRMIYASSVAVLGDDPWDVTQGRLVDPISIYGKTKYAGELGAESLCRESGVGLSVFRLANVYGAGQAVGSGGVITLWMDQTKSGGPLVLRGSGRQTRDFVYVGDVARVICGGMLDESDLSLKTVATGSSISIRDLGDLVWPLANEGPVRYSVIPRPEEEIIFSEIPGLDFDFVDLRSGLAETWGRLHHND